MKILEKCYEYNPKLDLEVKGIKYPYSKVLSSKQDSVIIINGKKEIMLGSNNYLGMTFNERVIEAAMKATEKYGTGCSGSRFLNGTMDIHLELEEKLANFLNKEDAITFSTGFQSNLGVVSALVGRNDYIFCDKENHASIYDACKLSGGKLIRYNHNDMLDLQTKLQNCPRDKGKLIITDGVFSMGGDLCNLPVLSALAKEFEVLLVVDDAHGLGTIGDGGRGTADYYNLGNMVDIIIGTFSKSLGSLGGFAVGKSEVINYIRHTSRPYIFSASMPPSNVAAALEALNMLEEEPERVDRLKFITNYMSRGLKDRNINIKKTITPIIPIMTYDYFKTFQVSETLFEKGVYVNPVVSPAVFENQCLLRTSYTSEIPTLILDEALDIFGEVLNMYSIGSEKLCLIN